MKISSSLTALILLAALAIGWSLEGKLSTARRTHDLLRPGRASPATAASSPSAAPSSRERREASDVKAIAASAIKVIQGMDNRSLLMREHGELIDFLDQLAGLNSGDLKKLVEEFNSAPGLDDLHRRKLLEITLNVLSDRNPLATLAYLTAAPELLAGTPERFGIVSDSIARAGEEQFDETLVWFEKNHGTLPHALQQSTRRHFVVLAARKDPGVAFGLIDRFKLPHVGDAVMEIMSQQRPLEKQGAALSALRGYLGSLTDEKQRESAFLNGISNLAAQVGFQGFDAATKWVSEANLSPKELEKFAFTAAAHNASADSGRWVEWVAKTLPPESAAKAVQARINYWTSDDSKAAGEWINTAPDGPMKQAAIQSYARTISSEDPRTAADWAVLLPEGEARSKTLTAIFWNWKKSDAAGAAAFAEKHGIK